MATDYTGTFYDTIATGCRSSAATVVPMVLDRVAASTVIDVGCGQGWWASEFAARGCDVTGVDGDYVEGRQVSTFVEHDLSLPLADLGRFDLAISLEVAEHLPARRAAGFVADLCSLADIVLFSAAIPHQTGAGHVNLRWQSWWANLFDAEGFSVTGDLRWPIWSDDTVEPWYRQNLLLASVDPLDCVGPLDVVHPVIHEWGR